MKILVIATAFAPKNVIGSIRPSKIAKSLIKMGHKVDVISPLLSEYDPQDELLMSTEMQQISYYPISYGAAYSRLKRKYQYQKETKASLNSGKPVQTGLKGLLVILYKIYAEWKWFLRAKELLEKRKLTTPYDIVFSTYPNIGVHWVALYITRRKWAKFWIADFRDPMVYEWQSRFEQFANRRLQAKIEKNSDRVTIVSQDAMEKFPIAMKLNKLHWIPNGFDSEDVTEVIELTQKRKPAPGLPLVFSYAGGLYGGKRNLSVFFNALRALIDEGEIQEHQIRIDYAGNDGAIMKSFAAAEALDSIVIDHGHILRKDAIALQLAADCALICSHNTKTDKGVLTGKIYEILMIKKPVLAIINGDLPDSELGRLIHNVSAGTVYEEANHEQGLTDIQTFIKLLVQEKRRNGVTKSNASDEAINQFSYHHITQQLINLHAES